MNRRILKATLLVTLLTPVLVIGSGQAAQGNDGCKPVNGHLEEMQAAGPGFAVVGRLFGGIQGTDSTTLVSVSPTDPSTPTVVHFVGKSIFQTKSGNIHLTVAGAFDLATGRFSDLFTVTGGTGEWSSASGQIHLIGFFDLASGIGESDFRGELCKA